MKFLITGGAGYIGSHTCVVLLEAGHDVFIADNFSNSSPDVIDRIKQITGKPLEFREADICDLNTTNRIMAEVRPDCVIHFAGLKSVAESIEKPLEYYRVNIGSTLSLLEAMNENGVNSLIFSSSATVYGELNQPPYSEDMAVGKCSNPYGWTKLMQEQIIRDHEAASDKPFSAILLRYFNPVGAHESGLIGEDPKGKPGNLMPIINQVAAGERDCLTVYGNDYDTPDGSCRRDYIHVMDLAAGHLKAAEYAAGHPGTEVFNLGTGRAYSVLELISAYEKASGRSIKYEIGSRRPGDLPDSWAAPAKAARLLGWTAERGISEICRDAWHFTKKRLR